MYNLWLGHCLFTAIPSEYSIYVLFTKLVAETRNEIIQKHVVLHYDKPLTNDKIL